MENARVEKISYEEIRNQSYKKANDNYGILSGYLTESVKCTLLANPNLDNDTNTALSIVYYNDEIVGRHMLMPTRLKAKEKIIMVNTGGSAIVDEQFRGKRLGTIVTRDCVIDRDYSEYIGQMYSVGGLSIIRKMNAVILELPMYFRICNFRPFLEAKGLKGGLLKIGTCIANIHISCNDFRNSRRIAKLKKEYSIKQESSIPLWVDDITVNDNYEYAEVHNRQWLQWCLDYKFTNHPKDKQCFYSIYDQNNNPIGFFLTKIRFESERGIYKKVTSGWICEWGSINDKILNEADLNLLALSTFDSDVDNVTTVIEHEELDKKIRSFGFFRHGNYQMAIVPGTLDRQQISDKKKWRIRFGGCNTMFI